MEPEIGGREILMSNQTDPDQGDDRISRFDEMPFWRCPQLGGPVTFGYCRQMNDSLPCSRMIGCWEESLDVLGFLQQHYDPDQIEQVRASGGRARTDVISDTLKRVLDRRDHPSK
jgi:hypothetical protein